VAINERLDDSAPVTGRNNADACRGAAVVILAVPYERQAELV
jgi:predicted dinucleotide-binding enzyme